MNKVKILKSEAQGTQLLINNYKQLRIISPSRGNGGGDQQCYNMILKKNIHINTFFDSVSEMKLNPFTLRFFGDLEKKFRVDYYKSSVLIFRFALILGIILYSSFAFLDIILIPEVKNYAFAIRFLAVVPLLIIIFSVSFHKEFKLWWQAAAILSVLIAGIGIIAIIWISPYNGKVYYYVGIILVLIYNYLITKIRFIWSSITGIVLIIFCLISITVSQNIPIDFLINNIFFLLSANILGMFGSYFLEYYSRRNFYLKYQLSIKNAELDEFNKTLDAKVFDKTKDLKLSEERFHNIFENTNAIMLIIDPNNGKLLDANPAAEKFYGYSEKQFVNELNISDINTLSQNEIQKKLNLVRKGEKAYFNFKHKLSNGNIRDVEVYSGKIILNEKDALFSIIHDITDRIIAQEELKKHREHLANLIKERTIELETKNTKVIESQQALAFLLEDMNASSKELSISNQKLEIANKEMEAFSYSVSHDLRAPLTRMDGFSGALIEMYKDKLDEKGVHYLKRIKASSKLMEQLIDDMLSLSRISRQQISLSNINISIISNKIIKKYMRLEPERKVDLKIEEGIELECDVQLINILFENILSNAWKFTSKNKKAIIEIGTKTIKDKNVIFIKDNGVGFEMKYSEKVFMPFQRLHTESEFAGTGIGMATVFRIIKRHNADIWTESKIGKGTTFYLSF